VSAGSSLKIGVVQVNAGTEIDANLQRAGELVREARAHGAALIALPENVSMMVQGRAKVLARVKPESEHPGVPFFQNLARETGAWLVTGTLGVLLEDGRVANRLFVVDPAGEVRGRYDKIHMFDVDLAGGESYRESATYKPGEKAVVVDTPWTRLGLSICYDVRFAYLYRALAKAGAGILFVPSAFTVPTGRAHWHVLLRARAIETGCYVVAPAQTGTHDEGRGTYGHALIVSPWGEIIADAGEAPGVLVAEIDLAKVAEARRMVPALGHDRRFELPA
jgi:predicted amidohydrolase